MISEKVIGTRLNMAVVERLEQLAVLKDKTVSQLVRMAVERLLEVEERTLHPLSLEAAVSLGGALATETNTILENTSNLVSSMSFGNVGSVYLLVHPESRELYVGSSTELTARLTHHKFSIKTGTHKNQSLNSWLVDEVVVVILESCESKKDAASKKALLVREQHYIDVLKASKDWTLLNLTAAASAPNLDKTVAKETPNKIAGVKTTVAAAVAAPTTPTAFEQFYTAVIEQSLIPILDEQKSSRDVVRLYEGCKDEQERRWFIEFLGSYNSSWLVSLGSSGKFPWIANLLELVKATPAKTNL